jgi:hypothetical protein
LGNYPQFDADSAAGYQRLILSERSGALHSIDNYYAITPSLADEALKRCYVPGCCFAYLFGISCDSEYQRRQNSAAADVICHAIANPYGCCGGHGTALSSDAALLVVGLADKR